MNLTAKNLLDPNFGAALRHIGGMQKSYDPKAQLAKVLRVLLDHGRELEEAKLMILNAYGERTPDGGLSYDPAKASAEDRAKFNAEWDALSARPFTLDGVPDQIQVKIPENRVEELTADELAAVDGLLAIEIVPEVKKA